MSGRIQSRNCSGEARSERTRAVALDDGLSDVDLSVDIARHRLANPVMPASGCFGPELNHLIARTPPGALVTKTAFSARRSGNPSPRLAETEYGMLNSVGIPSPGSEAFFARVLPRYRESGLPVFVSIGGLCVDDFLRIAEDCAARGVFAIEINVSCPNLEKGGSAIGTDPHLVYAITRGVVERVGCPVTAKLTPSVSSIAEGARAAEDGGADALVVANSFSGMAIDIVDRRAKLGRMAGGYTGPAIKPMSLKLVRDAAAVATVPIIGCGGIASAEDVAEFMIAGANAVQVGTATFSRADAMSEIVESLPELCRRLGVTRVADLIGSLES